MQNTRFTRHAITATLLGAVIAGVWWGGAEAGNHIDPWGIPLIIAGICVIFWSLFRDA